MKGAVALTLALTVAASGSGLPTCAMHEHASGHADHGLQIVAGHGQHGDLGCAAGGTCPAGGVAAPFAVAPVLTTPDLARDASPAVDRAYRSFLSPPLPPPPQR